MRTFAIAARIAACMLALAPLDPVTAQGSSLTFRITQVYSNIDGSVQFVELTEWAGLNGQHRIAGLKLTSTHGGIVKEYTIDRDLPSEQTANLSIIVATGARVPVVGDWVGACCYVPAVNGMPARFLAVDGGTIDFAGADRVSYTAMPTNGSGAIDRDGAIVAASLPICGSTRPCTRRAVGHSYTLAVEYYHEASDRYVLTAGAADIDALDSGRLAGWRRTGTIAYIGGGADAYPGMAQPVCRYYVPADNAHFLSASVDECAELAARYPNFVHETDRAFYVAVPDAVTGECPPDPDFNGGGRFQPLYRLWNARVGSEHRYTRDRAQRDAWIALGYVPEGAGPLGVAMCTG